MEIQGVGFAGAKGFAGGFGARMLTPFGEPAIKQFVAATVEGEPKEIFPFLGSSRLAETIDRFGVSAVLHGHAHLGTYAAATEKGIPVYNCSRSVNKQSGRPYALIEI